MSNKTLITENDSNPDSRQYINFADTLEKYGLQYINTDYYLQVGEIIQVQGWILHLSVIKPQLSALFEIVIPELIRENVPFKIIRNNEIAKYLLDANLGYAKLGKVVCIYPKTDKEALLLAQKLIRLTASFRGPAIPTNIHLGSIVYTRYGSFNPIMRTDTPDGEAPGNEIRYIYNTKGELVPDYYTIPFVLPENVVWPFGEITQPQVPVSKKLLKNTYKPLTVIKPDAKGRVIKGIYIKGFLNIKHCIIKEGKYNMWVDEQGRDIQDRLMWQHELCKDLANDIPFPKIFDLFKENNDMYLVMEFIKGDSLENIVLSTYKGNSWFQLSAANQLLLIGYLLKIITIIQRFHERAYVHRDITPNNFLIDKKGRIFLIDMELSYSLANRKPYPAFKLGTFGYYSPEQEAQQTPTIKEDIYAIGALMAFIFTGLTPVKFGINVPGKLIKSLLFFTRNEFLSDTIAKCLSTTPQERPLLETIKENIEKYQRELVMHLSQVENISAEIPDKDREQKFTDLINAALKGLTSTRLMTEDCLWDAQILKKDESMGTVQVERAYSAELHNGMTGIVYMLSKAKILGYNIDPIMEGYANSWKYLQATCLNNISTLKPELYGGAAGIALAISEGMNAGLLAPDNEYKLYLQQCFQNVSENLDLAAGVAGQGIALLQCRRWLSPDFTTPLLTQYLETLLAKQQDDGSWNTDNTPGSKKNKIIGLAYGVSGIVCFLLMYANLYPDEHLNNTIRKALGWLKRQSTRKKDIYYWNDATRKKSISQFSCDIGIPGIALVFIKAYKHFKDPFYKEIATGTLQALSSCPVHVDYSQAMGIAGLGEVYLEAYKAFKEEEWQHRANWIANSFAHTLLENKDGVRYWSMNDYPDPVADLMTGSSGIIHFLMKYQLPDKLDYLLLSTD
ncbi:lanthionine synthetase LanC family protein [Chitinophaga niastensis]|uniref:lanthionine synthetase LanC family protein n=1 Tax=Chitinophaga niastensis TaxID=536980 RepID=UPI0013050507|nr:lanthionine synthetase LanC family protein [Chitinophaga niastensis]